MYLPSAFHARLAMGRDERFPVRFPAHDVLVAFPAVYHMVDYARFAFLRGGKRCGLTLVAPAKRFASAGWNFKDRSNPPQVRSTRIKQSETNQTLLCLYAESRILCVPSR